MGLAAKKTCSQVNKFPRSLIPSVFLWQTLFFSCFFGSGFQGPCVPHLSFWVFCLEGISAPKSQATGSSEPPPKCWVCGLKRLKRGVVRFLKSPITHGGLQPGSRWQPKTAVLLCRKRCKGKLRTEEQQKH